MNEKYVVFKREDWDGWLADEGSGPISFPPEVGDAVVIRKQDLFAPGALSEYGNSIVTVLELCANIRIDIGKERRRHLLDVADYFFTESEDARRGWRKVPD